MRRAVLTGQYQKREVRRMDSRCARKQRGDLCAGFDRIQPRNRLALHAQTLATLGTTTSENRAAALGGHTGAETVRLSALALVRLIRALHDVNPF